MLENERCPYCGSDNFVTDDYDEDYGITDVVGLYWRCECNNCKKIFHITKWYKLFKTDIQTQKEWDEE